MAEDY